jgi:hypothetical protein
MTERGHSFRSHAVLSGVLPTGVSLGTYAGLTIDGAMSNTYGIQFSSNFISWVAVTDPTLTQDQDVWVDTSINLSAPGHLSDSYRVLAVPYSPGVHPRL